MPFTELQNGRGIKKKRYGGKIKTSTRIKVPVNQGKTNVQEAVRYMG